MPGSLPLKKNNILGHKKSFCHISLIKLPNIELLLGIDLLLGYIPKKSPTKVIEKSYKSHRKVIEKS